jgi:hypothetical protein
MIYLKLPATLKLDRDTEIALHEAESRYYSQRSEANSSEDQIRVTDGYLIEVFDLDAVLILSQTSSLDGQEQFEAVLEDLSISVLAVLAQALQEAHGGVLTGRGSDINRVGMKLDARQSHWTARYLATVLDEHSALREELARQSRRIGLERWCWSQNPRLSLGAVKHWRAKRWGPEFKSNNRVSETKRLEIENAIRSGPLAKKDSG